MKRHNRRWLLAMLLFGASSASAFVSLTEVVPESPRAGEPVFIVVNAGHCDGLSGAIELSITDNFILATVDGTHSETICGVPVRDHSFAIGSFPAGDYTLQLDYRHHPVEFPDDFTTEIVGSIQFVVVPAVATAEPVPSTGAATRTGLVLLVIMVAILALRRRTY